MNFVSLLRIVTVLISTLNIDALETQKQNLRYLDGGQRQNHPRQRSLMTTMFAELQCASELARCKAEGVFRSAQFATVENELSTESLTEDQQLLVNIASVPGKANTLVENFFTGLEKSAENMDEEERLEKGRQLQKYMDQLKSIDFKSFFQEFRVDDRRSLGAQQSRALADNESTLEEIEGLFSYSYNGVGDLIGDGFGVIGAILQAIVDVGSVAINGTFDWFSSLGGFIGGIFDRIGNIIFGRRASKCSESRLGCELENLIQNTVIAI